MGEKIHDCQSQCLYFTANTLSRKINELAEKAFAPIGLSPSYAYLLLIILSKEGLSQKDLSDAMQVKASTMTRFLDKLEYMRLINRESNGRSTFVFSTEEGKAFKEKIDKALIELYQNYTDLLGEEFAIKLTADINKAIGLIEK